MKRLAILSVIALLAFQQNALAWANYGHRIVIAVAQRHISGTARQNIAKYIDYNLQDDATWMDKHRNDKDIAYTTAWHVYKVDENHNYDPNARLGVEDAIYALSLVDYNLSHFRELSDSAVVMNIRMLIHFTGDMHCPGHSYFPGPSCFWKCRLGDIGNTFHYMYDHMPEWLYEGTPDEVAARIDDQRKSAIRKIQKGTPVDWAKQCGDRNAHIYEINAPLTEVLDPDTVEKSRETVSCQLRDAGYRLAFLIEKYFGKGK